MISSKWQTLIKAGWDWNRLLFRLLQGSHNNGIGVIYLDAVRYYREDQGWHTEHHEHLFHEYSSLLDHWGCAGRYGILDYAKSATGVFLFISLPHDGELAWHAEQISKEVHEQLSSRENRLADVHYGSRSIQMKLLLDSNGLFLLDQLNEAFMEARNKRNHGMNEKRVKLFHELSENRLITKYEPIYSLKTGILFGYESTVHGHAEETLDIPLPLSAVERSILDHSEVRSQSKIFLCIDMQTLGNLDFFSQKLRDLLKESQTELKNIVIEIPFPDASYKDWNHMKETVHFYKRQGFSICISRVHSDYHCWKMIDEVKPHFLKVERSLIRGCHADWIKEEMVSWIVSNARKINSQLVASGVDTAEEYDKISQSGFDFAQGYFFGLPEPNMAAKESILGFSVPSTGEDPKERRLQEGIPKEIIKRAKLVEPWIFVSEISDYFEQATGESYVIVTSGQNPIGLISKSKLYQRLGTRYGISLYLNKRVIEVMDPEPLVVNDISLGEVSQLAMSRDPERLYDPIIVKETGRVMGIVTIQSLLDMITKIQIQQAKDANPLTHLPGVHGIESEIRKRMDRMDEISVIYADLDRFKWFNDQFGFKKGDQVIDFLAHLLTDLQKQRSCRFIGHIGGDDFIVITSQLDAENLCREMIELFDKGIQAYYPESIIRELEANGQIEVIDRNGETVKCKGVSISLSIFDCDSAIHRDLSSISAQVSDLKRAAKAIKGSVFVRGEGCLAKTPG